MMVSKKPVLTLLAWLIPAQLVGLALQVATTTYASRYLFFEHLEAHMGLSDASHILTTYTSIRLVSSLTFLLGRIVIAVWLGTRRYETRASRWIWSLSGLFAGYWALALYFLLATREPASESNTPIE